MEARPGTKVRGKTVSRTERVNCRDWLEFEITDITHAAEPDKQKVRYVYRVPAKVDDAPLSMVQSEQSGKTTLAGCSVPLPGVG